MAELTDEHIDAAPRRCRTAQRHGPCVNSARYDRQTGRIVVELTNGCSFAFLLRLAQGLEVATEEHLAEVEILGTGHGLHGEALDVDPSTPGTGNRSPSLSGVIVSFKANAERRHDIPKQRHRATSSATDDAALHQRGSLMVWFTDAAIGLGKLSRGPREAISRATRPWPLQMVDLAARSMFTPRNNKTRQT